MGNTCGISTSGTTISGSISVSSPKLSGGAIAGIVIGSVGGAVLVLILLSFMIMCINLRRHKRGLKLAVQVRAELKRRIEVSRKLIPKIERLTSELRLRLLKSKTVELIAMLRAGQVTSVELLVTYYERALEMNEKFNFIVDINFEEALQLATKYDEQRKTKPDTCNGVLFGIPVSIKDSFGQIGFDLTSGCTAHIGKKATEDALAVKLLRAEGAIPFIRTNVPQALLSCVSSNNIWGETTNPWNKERNAGGSSGGEGAIVAARGSPLGLGSDQAGSLRIPAAFCGVYTFMSTQLRTSTKGHDKNGPAVCGQINVRSTSGPIGISTLDLELMCKTLMSNKLYEMGPASGDPHLPPLPWNENKAKLEPSKKLKIGYVETFDFFIASKAAKRAVQETIETLKKQGHEVTKVEIPFFEDLVVSQIKILAGEGKGRSIREKLKSEKVGDANKILMLAVSLNCCTRRVARCCMRTCGESKSALVLKNTAPLSAYEWLVNSCTQHQIRNKFFALWEEHKLDAFICPGYPIPAMKYKSAKFIALVSAYNFFFNYLDLPTGSLPVTVVKEDEQVYDEKTGRKQEEIERKARADMAGSKGMPMSIQVATLPYQDEKCIAIMKEIEKSVPFYEINKHPDL